MLILVEANTEARQQLLDWHFCRPCHSIRSPSALSRARKQFGVLLWLPETAPAPYVQALCFCLPSKPPVRCLQHTLSRKRLCTVCRKGRLLPTSSAPFQSRSA